MSNYLKPIEQRIINGKVFNVFRSENGKRVQKVGTNEIYGEAVDLAYLNNQYVEVEEQETKTTTQTLLSKFNLKR